MLIQFGKLYKNLIWHLIFIWATLIISSILILSVFYAEQTIENKINQNLFESTIIAHLTSNANTENLIDDLLKNKIINNVKLTTNLEAISQLQEKFDMKSLQKWITTKNISDYIIIFLNGNYFNQNDFQLLIDNLSRDERIKNIDFNNEELRRYGKIKSLLKHYKMFPMLIIILVTSIQLFLIRIIIRTHQKYNWQLWNRLGYNRLYKLPHLLIEVIITISAFILSFTLLIHIFNVKIYQLFDVKIVGFNIAWYWIIGLIVIYIFIALLNLIFRDKNIRLNLNEKI